MPITSKTGVAGKIGITGHQSLQPQTLWLWVEQELRRCLEGGEVERGLTSLAAGADQLFATILLEMGIPMTAIIPCQHYDKTFSSNSARDVFFRCRHKAEEVRVLEFSEPNEEAFWNAGKVVVRSSDVLIAVWNGGAAAGLGGTADVVAYARSLQKSVIHINPLSRTISSL